MSFSCSSPNAFTAATKSSPLRSLASWSTRAPIASLLQTITTEERYRAALRSRRGALRRRRDRRRPGRLGDRDPPRARGREALLIDKASFPRDKPCGGGLTLRAVRQLPVDPTPVVEHEVDRMEFRLGRRGRFERKGRRGAFVLMTQRRRLDHYLAEQAAAAGADFRDGVKVSLDEIDAEVIVGADGANGTTAKTLGLGGPIVHGVAFEGNAPYDDRYRGLALIELGTIPGGYGWIFPKGDHVNVGVGGWESEGPRLRDHLAALCARHAIDVDSLESVRGHRLPLRRAGFVPARGKALLVGDAAGLVDPLTGDGMYEAFVSARLAAEAALDVLAGRDGDGRAVHGAAAEGARPARRRIVGRQGRARPLPAHGLHARADAARLAGRRAARARRHQGAGRGAGPRAAAVEGDRGARSSGHLADSGCVSRAPP